MDSCPYCRGPLTDPLRYHWEGCGYLNRADDVSPMRVALSRSNPPRVVLVDGYRQQPAGSSDTHWPCYVCGEQRCARWVTVSYHVDPTQWPLGQIPMCNDCASQPDAILQIILDHGAAP